MRQALIILIYKGKFVDRKSREWSFGEEQAAKIEKWLPLENHRGSIQLHQKGWRSSKRSKAANWRSLRNYQNRDGPTFGSDNDRFTNPTWSLQSIKSAVSATYAANSRASSSSGPSLSCFANLSLISSLMRAAFYQLTVNILVIFDQINNFFIFFYLLDFGRSDWWEVHWNFHTFKLAQKIKIRRRQDTSHYNLFLRGSFVLTHKYSIF